MKVMFINSVVDYGSTGKIVRNLANSLKAEGHQVLIVYGRNTTVNQEDTFDISDRFGSFYHLVMTRLFDRHGLHSKRATKKLIAKIDYFKPDVIHLHNLHGYYLNYPLLMNYLKKQTAIKVVWTLHDMWAISGSVAHYSYYGCKEYKDGCVIANKPRLYPKSFFLLRQRKNFHLKKAVFTGFTNLKIVTVSNWQKKEVEKTFLRKYDITQIYNGLDFKDLEQFLNVEKKENMILGTNTYWNEEKGLEDFIELSKVLPKQYKIVLAGLSDKQIKTLPKNIEGLKLIENHRELMTLYAQSSLFLNLSVSETMGMTTVEALACGSPTIVYDKTAVPEIINEKVGQVVKAKDINGLLLAIKNVTKRNISPLVCHNFAKDNYNLSNMLKAYKKLYKN